MSEAYCRPFFILLCYIFIGRQQALREGIRNFIHILYIFSPDKFLVNEIPLSGRA